MGTFSDGSNIKAVYLKEQGVKCTATDLEIVHLIILIDNGALKNIDAQNAGRLSFNDNTFDWRPIKAEVHHPQRTVGRYLWNADSLKKGSYY